MDLKKIANKNQNLKKLYREIESWKNIISEKGSGNTWGARVDDKGNAVITYSRTRNKLSALAHELLHLKVQKDGYRRLKSVRSSIEDKELVQSLLSALDNELQHHKMFSKYAEMGFFAKDFYCDDDKNIRNYLNTNIENKLGALSELILDYLTLIAPGGSLRNDEICMYKLKFRNKLSSSASLDSIDSLFETWRVSNNFNAEFLVKNMFLLLQKPTCTWIGYDNGDGFPASGFFVDKNFTIE